VLRVELDAAAGREFGGDVQRAREGRDGRTQPERVAGDHRQRHAAFGQLRQRGGRVVLERWQVSLVRERQRDPGLDAVDGVAATLPGYGLWSRLLSRYPAAQVA